MYERPSGPLRQAGQLAVDRLGSARGLPPGDLVYARSLAVPKGEVLQFGQRFAGLPVLHAEVKVVALEGQLVALSSRLAPAAKLAQLALDTRPRLDQAQASARLRARRPGFQVRRGSLAIVVSPLWGAREVWLLDVVSQRPFDLLYQLVDARSGELLGGQPALSHAQGRVYSTNPVSGSLVTRELLGLTSVSSLQGSYAEVYRCWMAETPSGSGCTQEARPDHNGDYLYIPQEPDLQDPFAEVQAYYHVDRMYRWLASTFGFARTGSQRIFTVVNFQIEEQGSWAGYGNAAYGDVNGDGQGDLLFGEDTRDYAYDADVIYHEFGHLVVEEQAGLTVEFDELGLNTMPLTLNEGYADLFSCLLAGDANVGEHAIKDVQQLRSLEGQARCPESLTGESHEDSLIWSQAIWSVRSQTDQPELLEQVLYTTLAGLTPLADLQEGAAMIVQVAQQQDPALASLLTAEFDRRNYQECSRIIPLSHDLERDGFIFGAMLTPGLGEVPGSVQYRIDVPAEATRLDLELRVPLPWRGELGVYLRQDQPVSFSPTSIDADLRVPAGSGGFTMQLGQAQAPLIPGASYYLLVFNEDEGQSMFTVSYTTDAPPPAPPDQGVDGPITQDLGLDDGSGGERGGWSPGSETGVPAVGGRLSGGCSVGALGAGSGWAWPLLLLVALLARRRRRVMRDVTSCA